MTSPDLSDSKKAATQAALATWRELQAQLRSTLDAIQEIEGVNGWRMTHLACAPQEDPSAPHSPMRGADGGPFVIGQSKLL